MTAETGGMTGLTLGSQGRLWRLPHHLKPGSSLVDQIDLLRDCYRAQARSGKLRVLAMVVLPQAIHAVWRMAETEDPNDRWMALAQTITRHASSPLGWFDPWVADIPDDQLQEVVAHVYEQPVAWRLVDRAEDWPYSSLSKRGY